MVSKDFFSLKKCLNCFFIFTNPRPFSSEIKHYYRSNNYDSYINKNKSIFDYFYNIFRNRNISYKLKLISKYKKGNIRIYDYGCGIGVFLNKASQKGWNVKGFETNEKAKSIALESGIEIISPEELLKRNTKKFDIISLWHVLEHVYDLKETISKLLDLLKNDGYFVIAVPNINSWDAKKYKEKWAAIDVPRHLSHFNQFSMNKLFSDFGMKIVNVYPLKFDAYYISLLSENIPIWKYFSALINGWYSNYKAKQTLNYSSVIFFIQKI